MDFFKQKFNSNSIKEGQLFLINKPIGWTSFQVVNKMRWYLKNLTGLKKIKIGHAGTLDPLASGLLVVCTGKKTKSIHLYQNEMKTYIGTFTLGATTPSYDLETEIDNIFETNHIKNDLIEETARTFVGDINQIPPIYSAIKINGKRLYNYARNDESAEIKSRKVYVSKFEIRNINLPKVDFLISCSKGTYIRSIAHDFGQKLSSGAYLSSLKRIQIGEKTLDDAYSMKSVTKKYSEKNIKSVKVD